MSFVFLILHLLTLIGFVIAAFLFLGCMMGCYCFSRSLFNDNFRAFWYNERQPHKISRKKMTRLIDKMYKFSIKQLQSLEARTCPICLLDYRDQLSRNISSDLVQLKCSKFHIFHFDCLNTYIAKEKGSTCPLCRQNIEVQHPPMI